MARFISYAEKLKDPRWQRKRLEIMQRAEFACENCGDSESTLHVHHGYYETGFNPWDYPSDTLMCLCEVCHDSANSIRHDLDIQTARLSLECQWLLFDIICNMGEMTPVEVSKLRNASFEIRQECRVAGARGANG